MKGLARSLAVALEAVGICVILLGLGIEVYYEADVGLQCITGGAAIVAFGSLVFTKLIRRKD